MTLSFPPAPQPQAPLDTTGAPVDLARFLATRRSAGKMTFTAPGPDADTLADILRVAARIPDHRKVEPWRFITLTGEARTQFGSALETIAQTVPDLTEKDRGMAAALPLRAPCLVAVVSSPDADHKTPVWEQELSAGALCYNLLLAARAAGFGAAWLTEWIAFDRQVDALLGLSPDERIAGFIYIGTVTAQAPERPRPDMTVKVSAWTGT